LVLPFFRRPHKIGICLPAIHSFPWSVYLVRYKVKTQRAIWCYGLEMRTTFTIQLDIDAEVF
jgi:hypothetical protein